MKKKITALVLICIICLFSSYHSTAKALNKVNAISVKYGLKAEEDKIIAKNNTLYNQEKELYKQIVKTNQEYKKNQEVAKSINLDYTSDSAVKNIYLLNQDLEEQIINELNKQITELNKKIDSELKNHPKYSNSELKKYNSIKKRYDDQLKITDQNIDVLVQKEEDLELIYKDITELNKTAKNRIKNEEKAKASENVQDSPNNTPTANYEANTSYYSSPTSASSTNNGNGGQSSSNTSSSTPPKPAINPRNQCGNMSVDQMQASANTQAGEAVYLGSTNTGPCVEDYEYNGSEWVVIMGTGTSGVVISENTNQIVGDINDNGYYERS